MMSPAADAPIEFASTSSFEDAMAAEAPTRRARTRGGVRARWFAIFALVFLLTVFGTGIFDNSSDPAAFLKTMMSAKMALMTCASLIAIIAVMAGAMAGVRMMNRALRRKMFVDLRRHHPAVDTRDPTLRMTRRFRFDETGMTTTTAFDEVWESWSRITALDETPDLLVLRAGGLLNYPLPKDQLSPELRERLQRYVDSRSHSRWPF